MATWPNLNYDYKGAHVLVTGGSNGIGAGIAAAYRDAGANVIITGTRASAADYDGDLSGYRYLQLQLTDDAQIDAVAAALPKLDILVNNAGANFAAQNEYEPDVFEKSVRVNLLSAYRMAHACLPKLMQSELPGGASVIGIASMTSYFGVEVVPGYGAAKAGLIQLTRHLAAELRRRESRPRAINENIVDRLGQTQHSCKLGSGGNDRKQHDGCGAAKHGIYRSDFCAHAAETYWHAARYCRRGSVFDEQRRQFCHRPNAARRWRLFDIRLMAAR